MAIIHLRKQLFINYIKSFNENRDENWKDDMSLGQPSTSFVADLKEIVCVKLFLLNVRV